MWHGIQQGVLILDVGLSQPAAINWGSTLASILVLLLVGALVGAMIFVIKLTTDDSDKHKQIKEFVETLFGTPAHLRPGSGSEEAGKDPVKDRSSAEPFHEPCPACDTTITHEDIHCPSCGLRLQ